MAVKDSRINIINSMRIVGLLWLGIKGQREDQYVAFLDADDYLLAEKLQRELDFMYTSEPEWADYNHLLKRTVIATSTVLLNKIEEFQMPL